MLSGVSLLLGAAALLGAAPRAALAGYLHAPLPALHVPAPVVSYGYHTAVVTKPLAVHPLPLHHHHPVHPLLHHHHHPIHPLPIATSYQSFHKVDRPVYPIIVKALPLHPPLHPPLHLPLHPPLHLPLHPPLHAPLHSPLAYGPYGPHYGPHYPHYLR